MRITRWPANHSYPFNLNLSLLNNRPRNQSSSPKDPSWLAKETGFPRTFSVSKQRPFPPHRQKNKADLVWASDRGAKRVSSKSCRIADDVPSLPRRFHELSELKNALATKITMIIAGNPVSS
jgi:hypothetical protein